MDTNLVVFVVIQDVLMGLALGVAFGFYWRVMNQSLEKHPQGARQTAEQARSGKRLMRVLAAATLLVGCFRANSLGEYALFNGVMALFCGIGSEVVKEVQRRAELVAARNES